MSEADAVRGATPVNAAQRALRYRASVLSAAPRLLGALDRDRSSPTAGSFDRDHWAWKFRDFPIAMLQFGILPLVELWTRPWHGNQYAGSARLREWIGLAIDETLRRQHPEGAFDSVAPFSKDHGATLAMVYVLATSGASMGDALGEDRMQRIRTSIRRACQFASRSAEDYAFITNHHALFALAWLRASVLLDDDALRRRADDEVAQALAHQSPEGWYVEYGGADPGYQSLGMSYLARYARERPLPELDASLGRAVSFMSHCVQLDGSVGGTIGSRLTALWYPDGFELLAGSSAVAAAVATATAAQLECGNVVTPASSDIHNLPTLLYSYLLAAEAAEHDAREDGAPTNVSLPCDALRGEVDFPDAGLVVVGTPAYHGIVNARRGGVTVVHARGTRSLAWEDAGYVLRAGKSVWTSAMPSPPESLTMTSEDGVRLKVRFQKAHQDAVTPLRFLLLRVLNLTVFRLRRVGAAVRGAIIRRLITGRMPGPFTLERSITFTRERIRIHDVLRRDGAARVDRGLRTRHFQPMHMGSARYFHERDLTDGSDADLDADVRELNERGLAQREVEIRFADSALDGIYERRMNDV